MVSCPRCGLHLTRPSRCPECGALAVAEDGPRTPDGSPAPRSPFAVAATLLDPFEGQHLAELLEARRIPTRLRRRRHVGWRLHLHGPRWGELLVPVDDLAEARTVVAALRADLAAGAELTEARAWCPRPAPDVEPTRGPLCAYTGGGPPVVSPFGRFGWIEVAGGRLGPGGHLEGRLSTGSRLVRTVELCLALEPCCPVLRDPGADVLTRQVLDLPEEATVAFTLPVPGASEGPRGYRLEARVLGRSHVLATGTLHLRPRPTLLAAAPVGQA